MKKFLHFITIIILILCCVCLTNCKKTTSDEDKELERQKQVLTNELETLSRYYDKEKELATYDSHTFYTIEKMGDGGHIFSGKIYFKDQYGTTYFSNYRAIVGKGSWYPEISITEIEPLLKWGELEPNRGAGSQ